MPEILVKLRPDRDLQCYFLRPSAIAALSESSASGVTLSGTWRQQFDWSVVEWNRDNVFDHPSFRNLPDGDLSGLTLTYDETRSNCIPMDSSLFPTVDWPSLRIWAADQNGHEDTYFVPLKDHAVAIAGSYAQASAQIVLSGTITAGDYVGFALLDEHYTYQMHAGDTLAIAASTLTDAVNAFSNTLTASRAGAQIVLTIRTVNLQGQPIPSLLGANGNRLGLYTFVAGAQTEHWDVTSKQFSGGASPSKWHVTLPFSSLAGSITLPGGAPVSVPVHSVRKVRWTYAAALQPAAYVRSEFQVVVSNWNITGSGRPYFVAGPGSRRFNDDAPEFVYSTHWNTIPGISDLPLDHYYGGTVHFTSFVGASVVCDYTAAQTHSLYLGTRRVTGGPQITVSLDGGPAIHFDLSVPLEDILVREFLGQAGPGHHTVVATLSTAGSAAFCFDFLELAVPTTTLPGKNVENRLTLATDWDTDHSIALPPERTAWIMDSLGFQGRPNHYVGALWFYELVRPLHVYASASITFAGAPDTNNGVTQVSIGRSGDPVLTTIAHLNLIGDTPDTLAKCFELLINAGSNAIWAQASGSQLLIQSRSMGFDGNNISIAVSPSPQNFVSSPLLQGGDDGEHQPPDIVNRDGWVTDLQSTPRLNRAVRDWCRSYFKALKSYGHSTAAAAFSTELQHGDPSLEAGIAQRYPSGNAVIVNTPALQTNFSPQSLAFWKHVYTDIATVQTDAGLQPYIQFGEVQWWYFPDDQSGMPFYDAYTTSTFKAQYGHDLSVIATNTVDPASVPDEAAFLPHLIGNHTAQIMAYVLAAFPNCQFEVLYPPDVNRYALNKVINYPRQDWTPAKLTCLKTESFTFTFDLNLDLARQSMNTGDTLGFPPSQRSHLVGIENFATAWLKEVRMAESGAFESVVLFALDQFCLMGYSVPFSKGLRRSVEMG